MLIKEQKTNWPEIFCDKAFERSNPSNLLEGLQSFPRLIELRLIFGKLMSGALYHFRGSFGGERGVPKFPLD